MVKKLKKNKKDQTISQKKVNNGEAETQGVKVKRKHVNKRHENGLYSDAKLTPEDIQSDLYKRYIEVPNIQQKCKRFLRDEKNKKGLPKWAQAELDYLTEIMKKRDQAKYKNNKKGIIDRQKNYNEGHKEEIKKYHTAYNTTHKQAIQEYQTNYGKTHKPETNLRVKQYYKRVIGYIKKIRDGKIDDLSDQQLLSVQSFMKGIHKSKFRHYAHGFYLGDKDDDTIYDRNNLPAFKAFLKSQVGSYAISQINFNELNNMPFDSDVLSDEEDEKEEYLNFDIPEDNQEGGEKKPVTEPEKTLNWYGMTTFKPNEDQYNGNFDLDNDTSFNLDDAYSNNISKVRK